jgi:hypothetical protein
MNQGDKKEVKGSGCQLELFGQKLDKLVQETSTSFNSNYVAPVIHLHSYIGATKVDQFYERVKQLTSHLD